jgi:hypothetical protein
VWLALAVMVGREYRKRVARVAAPHAVYPVGGDPAGNASG